jgi:hypothetical protein
MRTVRVAAAILVVVGLVGVRPTSAQEEEPAPAIAADPLDWLARHQSPDGGWDADGFGSRCVGEPCASPGPADADVTVTGLSLLAYLADGYTHRTPRYGNVVRAATRRLTGLQRSDGRFTEPGDPAQDLGNACALLALVELEGMTQSPHLRVPVRRALEGTLRGDALDPLLNPATLRADTDGGTRLLLVLAIEGARSAGQALPERAGASLFRRLSSRDSLATSRDSVVESALHFLRALVVRSGRDAGAAASEDWDGAARRFLLRAFREESAPPPLGSPAKYLQTRLAHAVGGRRAWAAEGRRLSTALERDVLPEQRGCAAGSVDPTGECVRGGRIAATAFAALTRSILHAYPAHRREADPEAKEDKPRSACPGIASSEWRDAHEDTLRGWDSRAVPGLCDAAAPCTGRADLGYDVACLALSALAELEHGAAYAGPPSLGVRLRRIVARLHGLQRDDGHIGADDGAGARLGHVLATLALARFGEQAGARISAEAARRAAEHVTSHAAAFFPSEAAPGPPGVPEAIAAVAARALLEIGPSDETEASRLAAADAWIDRVAGRFPAHAAFALGRRDRNRKLALLAVHPSPAPDADPRKADLFEWWFASAAAAETVVLSEPWTEPWKRWRVLLSNTWFARGVHTAEGCASGSFDPGAGASAPLGRVGATLLAALADGPLHTYATCCPR